MSQCYDQEGLQGIQKQIYQLVKHQPFAFQFVAYLFFSKYPATAYRVDISNYRPDPARGQTLVAPGETGGRKRK